MEDGHPRRRYGALAVFADVSVAVLLFLAVVGPLWMVRRQRDRRRMAQMRAVDELQERREREDVLAALLSGTGEPSAGGLEQSREMRISLTDGKAAQSCLTLYYSGSKLSRLWQIQNRDERALPR